MNSMQFSRALFQKSFLLRRQERILGCSAAATENDTEERGTGRGAERGVHETFRSLDSWSLGNSSFRLDPCPTLRYKYFPAIPFTVLSFCLYARTLKRRITRGAKRSITDERLILFLETVTRPSATNFSKSTQT